MLHFFFAALGGHAGAQMAMGYRHWNGGLGVPKNCSKAVRFYEMAANKVLSCLWKRCRLSVFGVRCSVFFSVFCFLVFGVPTYSARRVLNGMTSVHAVLSCLPFVLTCPRLPLPNTRWPTT